MATPGTVEYPAALDSVTSLINATNQAANSLSAQLNAGATTASLVSAAGFPSSGTFSVDGEIIYYTGKSTNDLTGCVRGREGTTDATHTSGSTVLGRATARHHTVLADAIIAAQTELGINPSGLSSTVASKLGGLAVNAVTDYGAVADSSTDNTTAINNAITAVNSAGGGIVYLPAATGTYRIGQLVMKSNVWLRGAGERTELRSIASNPATTGLVVLSDNDDSDFWISDLVIHGLKGSQSNAISGVHVDRTGAAAHDCRYRIWNCRFIQCKGSGVALLDDAGAGMMWNVALMSNDEHGIVLSGNASDSHFASLYSGLNGKDAYHIDSGTNKWVACEAFFAGQADAVNFGDGFYIEDAFDSQFIGCKAQDNGRRGWYLNGSVDVTITGCKAWRNAGDALRLNGCADNSIELDVGFSSGGSAGVHDRIVELVGTNSRNNVVARFTDDALTAATAPVNGTTAGNKVEVWKGAANTSAVTFAASYTPDPYLYEVVTMTLTSNITINAPSFQHRGQRLRFIFTQDGTGTRTHTFNAVFKTNWTPNTSAGKTNVIEFECDGTNWWQVGNSVNL